MGGRRLALVVTVDRYDNPGLRALAAPAADARALAEVLGNPDLGGFDLEFLHNPTSSTTYERVEGLLADRQPADLVLLHFSCHGLKDVGGELYLATTNTIPDRMASTAVDSAWINRLMQRSRAQRVVLLLDCCYGGAFERGVLARSAGDIDVGDQFRPGHLGQSRGRVVITASTAMEYAFEGSQLSDGAPAGPSVFTGALAEGIRSGEADRDQDGYVALDELYDYVYERVQRDSPRQTPCKWEFGLRGELYMARNPNRRVPPIPLPQDLLDLLDHPTPAARLAAVEELGRLAAGTNLTWAAAARLALDRLVDDDSRRVSAAAAEAMRRSALHEPTVDHGAAATPRDRRRLPPTTVGRKQAAWVLVGSLLITALTGLGVRAFAQNLPHGAKPASTAQPAPSAVARRDSIAKPVAYKTLKVGEEPEGVAVSPDSKTVYVTNQRTHSLWMIDAPAWTVRVKISLPHTPWFVAVSPDGGRVYVSMFEDDLPGTGSAVTAIDTKTRAPVVTKPIGPKPYALAVAPDGRVWVPVHDAKRVDVLDGTSLDVVDEVGVPETPHAVALSADGKRAYTPDHESDKVSVIDVRKAAVEKNIPAGKSPHSLAVAPDGRTVVVANYNGGTINTIDTTSLLVSKPIPVGTYPQCVAFSADGKHAYAVNEGTNSISTLDVATAQTTTLQVGRSPRTIAVAPDGRYAYVTNGDDNTVTVLRVSG
jgi:YVTN family beta-propeller protein